MYIGLGGSKLADKIWQYSLNSERSEMSTPQFRLVCEVRSRNWPAQLPPITFPNFFIRSWGHWACMYHLEKKDHIVPINMPKGIRIMKQSSSVRDKVTQFSISFTKEIYFLAAYMCFGGHSEPSVQSAKSLCSSCFL